VASPLTPQQQQQQQTGDKVAGSPASLGQAARSGSRVVSTPEQLQRYLVCCHPPNLCHSSFRPMCCSVQANPDDILAVTQDSFEASMGGPPSPERGGFGAFAGPGYNYAAGAPQGSPLGYAGTTAGGAPVTVDVTVPRYRPSLQASLHCMPQQTASCMANRQPFQTSWH
jgi:hypothetical protein